MNERDCVLLTRSSHAVAVGYLLKVHQTTRLYGLCVVLTIRWVRLALSSRSQKSANEKEYESDRRPTDDNHDAGHS